MRFLYVMDPMCGWCYAFQPELEGFLARHPSAEVDWIMGGLAPDTNEPMDDALKQTIASYWHKIEAVSQVTFNHDFWERNTPYRSTYAACRAVIAAERLRKVSSASMVKSIQSAYYQHAKNPSLEDTLVACASDIGFDAAQFLGALRSDDTEQLFQQHLSVVHQLQVTGFPALFLTDEQNRAYPLAVGFTPTAELHQRFGQITGSK
ncbi:MAG: DsbA family protein [Pseudomonadota bacterium]